jgi:RHS repeat-associated protein
LDLVILLAEHDEPTLAAKKKRQLAPLKLATSTPKNRVWGFENIPSGRPCVEFDLTWETAIGSVQYTYRNASGRAEWLSRDPLGESQGPNIYDYVSNNPVDFYDPLGLQTVLLTPIPPEMLQQAIDLNRPFNRVELPDGRAEIWRANPTPIRKAIRFPHLIRIALSRQTQLLTINFLPVDMQYRGHRRLTIFRTSSTIY